MPTEQDSTRRYHAAMHAVQSGVAAKMDADPTDTTPKQLRVGVNSALLNSSALATLLMEKGIITMEEYVDALADAAEAEKARYETWLSTHHGTTITLA